VRSRSRPKPVKAKAGDDSIHPRGEFLGRVILIEVLPDPDERFLDDVLSLILIGEHAERKGERVVLMRPDEKGESLSITPSALCYDVVHRRFLSGS